MFEKAEYMERLEKVKKSMSERGIDVLFISNPANMCYLTGHNAWSFYVHQAVVVALDDEMPHFLGRYMDAFAGVVKTTYLDENHVHPWPDYYVQNPTCHPMDHMAETLKSLGYGIVKFTYTVERWRTQVYLIAHFPIPRYKSVSPVS